MKRLMEHLDDLAGQDIVLSRDGRQRRDGRPGDRLASAVPPGRWLARMAKRLSGVLPRRKGETQERRRPVDRRTISFADWARDRPNRSSSISLT